MVQAVLSSKFSAVKIDAAFKNHMAQYIKQLCFLPSKAEQGTLIAQGASVQIFTGN